MAEEGVPGQTGDEDAEMIGKLREQNRMARLPIQIVVFVQGLGAWRYREQPAPLTEADDWGILSLIESQGGRTILDALNGPASQPVPSGTKINDLGAKVQSR